MAALIWTLLHQAAEHDYLQKCIDQPLLVLSLNYNVYSMLFDIQSGFYIRCGRVMADNIAYARFRKSLLI